MNYILFFINRSAKVLERKIRKRTSQKLVLLFLLVILAFVGIALYLTYINTTHGEQYARQVLSQTQASYDSRTIPYQRGDITDRNGTILATSEKVYNVILDCKVVNTIVEDDDGNDTTPYVEPTIKALVELLGLDEADLRERLTGDTTKESQYQIIKENVSITDKKQFEQYVAEYEDTKTSDLTEDERAAKAERANIKGVWFEDDYLRYYPLGSVACDLIGFTNSGNSADWGLEGYYSSVLNGVNGRQYGYYNDDADIEQTIIEPESGHNVISTIDVNIQQIIRSAIQEFNISVTGDAETDGANNVAIIVMNPNNGEVLGMDSTGWYDLNNPGLDSEYTDEEQAAMTDEELSDAVTALNKKWRNFCISDTFEPGSTAKPMNIAGALESGSVSVDDHYYCEGYYYVNNQEVKCSVYPSMHGDETLAQTLANSCNPGLMQVAEAEGKDNFLKYQTIFGFGSKTGIDLPGEASGIVYDSSSMGDMELASSSFGQGYTVTMIQQIAAFCSVINGGYYYQPHVVKEITDVNGSVVQTIEPTIVSQTISSDVSDIMRDFLQQVVVSGTGTLAKVPGYTMGGKTGTAETYPRGNGEYVVSFIGYAPADNPQVCVYVVIDRAKVDELANNSELAQKVAKNVFEELLPYMNIFMDDTDLDSDTDTDTDDGEDSDDSEEEADDEDSDTDDTETDNGVGAEVAADNENVSAPEEEAEDPYVENGGNNLTTEGITNDEADLVNE